MRRIINLLTRRERASSLSRKSYTCSCAIGNAICEMHNVAFMWSYTCTRADTHAFTVCVCTYARSVIKASAQTDKHSFRPTLITRCVIYHAHVYNARVKTNLYGRESNCSAHYFRVVLIIDAIGQAPRFSININAHRVISAMNHSRSVGAIIYTNHWTNVAADGNYNVVRSRSCSSDLRDKCTS